MPTRRHRKPIVFPKRPMTPTPTLDSQRSGCFIVAMAIALLPFRILWTLLRWSAWLMFLPFLIVLGALWLLVCLLFFARPNAGEGQAPMSLGFRRRSSFSRQGDDE
jgi:hypothetical protein